MSRRRVRSAAYRARRQQRRLDRQVVTPDEPADDFLERAAERADLAQAAFNQELRDAGRGHLVQP